MTTHLDQYRVIGFPVKHSLSPRIHNAFAAYTAQAMHYDFLEIHPSDLLDRLDQIRQDHTIKGLSVTLPHKEALYRYCDTLDPLAQQAGAVSNVIIDEKRIFHGLNLDGIGLVKDIQRLGHHFHQRKVLILGAGGATRGILGAIIAENPASITIANRTVTKAQVIVEAHHHLHNEIDYCALDQISNRYDIIINATSASVDGCALPLKKEQFSQDSFGYDLMYHSDGTVFTLWCQKQNIPCADGKGMLIEISREIFKRWRGITPPQEITYLL